MGIRYQWLPTQVRKSTHRRYHDPDDHTVSCGAAWRLLVASVVLPIRVLCI
ncbi:Uncharacterised protein [Mycobacterium tuberculosis]|nr:Uncharacterised protein [Mycobacterium tuberculosis]